MSPDVQLLSALASLRRRWRQRVLLESLGWIVVAALLAVIAAVLLTRYINDATSSVLAARVVGYSLIVAAVIRFLIIPLMRRASDERFALDVEELAPQL